MIFFQKAKIQKKLTLQFQTSREHHRFVFEKDHSALDTPPPESDIKGKTLIENVKDRKNSQQHKRENISPTFNQPTVKFERSSLSFLMFLQSSNE